MTPRPARLFLTALGLLLLLPPGAGARAFASAKRERTWTRVTSRNFTLIGDATEEQIRRVALRLEQFRQAFSLFSRGSRLSSGVPVNVVVFRDDAAFAPFKPAREGRTSEVAGYFAAGPEANFIALTAAHRAEDPYSVIFHEYAHLLVRNNMRNTPAWLNEGLAEYYSTFELTDNQRKVRLGRAVARHAQLLRRERFIPLGRLVSLEATSQLHDDARERTGLFYAESWALVHYFLHGRGAAGRAQFDAYVRLLDGGEASGVDAFRRAFGATPETLEGELRQYVERGAYPSDEIALGGRLEPEPEMHASALAEAEREAYLGDLLLHVKRFDAAEEHLTRAVRLDPDLAYARAALGALRIKQERHGEAVEHFERAARAGTRSHLAHFYLALALAGVAGEGDRWLVEPTPERTARIRAELTRAIALAPDFAPAYELLALVNLLAGEQLDESIALVRRAAELAPGRTSHALTLAELHMRKKEYAEARRIAAPLASADGGEARDRARARAVLDTIETAERVERERREREAAGAGVVEDETPERPSAASLRRAADGESQGLGFLLDIECPDEGGVHLRFRLDDGRTLRLHKGELRRITFVTYTTEVKRQIECGLRTPANRVLVTYRPATPARAQADGEVVAVDFIPQDWN
ncbi:MAG TPA: DUF1570 domain-containing protein [Pyrinomonadaceae bacterium]|nr:DUF1570 domain-containing protein [Pyrinomonadaceae bacterium]